MKIRVINFLYNEKKMHIRTDAELGRTVNHLKEKFGEVEIHSVYQKNGTVLYFTPPAKASELVPDTSCMRCLLSLLFFLSFLIVAYFTVKYGYYTNH